MDRCYSLSRAVFCGFVALMGAGVLSLTGAGAFGQGGAEGVRLRHAPAEGHAHVYEVRAALRLEQRMGDEEPRTTELMQNARVELRVEHVDADGAARIALRVGSLMQRVDDGEDVMLFEFPKVTTEIEPDTERYKAFASVCRAITQIEATLVVNAEGLIASVDGLEGVMRAMGEQDQHDQSVLGVFTARQLAATLQPIFNADRRDAGAPVRRVGDGWQTTETIALGPAGAFEIVTEMRMAALADGMARVAGAPVFAILRPSDADAATPRVRIVNQSGSLQMQWDTRKSMLAARVAMQDIETVWTLGELELTQTQRAATSLTRVE